MAKSITERAMIQLAQMVPASEQPQNRVGQWSVPAAQKMILERLFQGLYPEVYEDIQKSEEYQQLEADSPLHPEQFEAIVKRFAEHVELDYVAAQQRKPE